MRRLAYGCLACDPGEQGMVCVDIGDRIRHAWVLRGGSSEARLLNLESEKPRVLSGTHVDLWMLAEEVPERGCSRLCCTYDKEVWSCCLGTGTYGLTRSQPLVPP